MSVWDVKELNLESNGFSPVSVTFYLGRSGQFYEPQFPHVYNKNAMGRTCCEDQTRHHGKLLSPVSKIYTRKHLRSVRSFREFGQGWEELQQFVF